MCYTQALQCKYSQTRTQNIPVCVSDVDKISIVASRPVACFSTNPSACRTCVKTKIGNASPHSCKQFATCSVQVCHYNHSCIGKSSSPCCVSSFTAATPSPTSLACAPARAIGASSAVANNANLFVVPPAHRTLSRYTTSVATHTGWCRIHRLYYHPCMPNTAATIRCW